MQKKASLLMSDGHGFGLFDQFKSPTCHAWSATYSYILLMLTCWEMQFYSIKQFLIRKLQRWFWYCGLWGKMSPSPRWQFSYAMMERHHFCTWRGSDYTVVLSVYVEYYCYNTSFVMYFQNRTINVAYFLLYVAKNLQVSLLINKAKVG